MVEIHKFSVKINLWPPHFRTFCELVEAGGGGEQTNYILHMDYNVRVQHFPAASLQTWATPEKLFTSIRSKEIYGCHTFVLFVG